MECVNRKRVRDESYDSSEFDSPHVKRLREDLFDNLVDSDPDPTVHDLASVMKSFEEEICGSSSLSRTVSVVDLTSDSGESQPVLGYLLEASDDELGLPPSTTSENEEAKTEETEFVQVLADSNGPRELWGFEDDIPSFDSLEFVVVDYNGNNNGEYVALDGLFDYSDLYFGSSDFLCRSDTLPTL